jgi:HK97 family phage prohead protease
MQKMCVSLDVKSLREREFEGLGAMFRNRDLGGDIIVPGAFTKTLREPAFGEGIRPMLWMHKPDKVIGRWDSMSETDDGLYVKGALADTDLGNEIHTLLKMQAVRGLSIGYEAVDFNYDKKGNRLLKQIELHEVSVVSMPMNPLAQVVHVKSQLSAAGEYVPTIKEFESILRDAGCSRNIAKQIAYKVRMLEDEGDDGDRSETPPRQAVELDAARALEALSERITADLIRRKVG